HQLQAARQRGVPIITFNPLHERGLERFTNPQSPTEMLTLSETEISTQYHQLFPGGDLAALVGMCKLLLEMDDAGKNNGGGRALDPASIDEHTRGFQEFADVMRRFEWHEIEACSGLTRAALEAATKTYRNANAVIACYGMGLTQHRSGVLAIQMLSNLLLMR